MPVLPVTIRLPRPKERDPLFGLTRGHYFSLEKEGLIELVRLRTRGRSRGVTLIPVERMTKVLQAQMQPA
jgi:hypothetical protein